MRSKSTTRRSAARVTVRAHSPTDSAITPAACVTATPRSKATGVTKDLIVPGGVGDQLQPGGPLQQLGVEGGGAPAGEDGVRPRDAVQDLLPGQVAVAALRSTSPRAASLASAAGVTISPQRGRGGNTRMRVIGSLPPPTVRKRRSARRRRSPPAPAARRAGSGRGLRPLRMASTKGSRVLPRPAGDEGVVVDLPQGGLALQAQRPPPGAGSRVATPFSQSSPPRCRRSGSGAVRWGSRRCTLPTRERASEPCTPPAKRSSSTASSSTSCGWRCAGDGIDQLRDERAQGGHHASTSAPAGSD